MTSKLRDQVREFHRAYGQPIGDKPALLTTERLQLRLRLIAEEFCEMLEACGAGCMAYSSYDDQYVEEVIERGIDCTYADDVDLVALCDALADLEYVIEGFRVELGVDGGPIADEVHRSNLSKLDDDGKPVLRLDGKVTKGPNFTPPDIAGELAKQGYGK